MAEAAISGINTGLDTASILDGLMALNRRPIDITIAKRDLEVEKLERKVEKMEDKMDRMMDSDEEIMEQHEQLFKKLEQGSTGYSYN